MKIRYKTGIIQVETSVQACAQTSKEDWTAAALKPGEGESSRSGTANVLRNALFGNIIPAHALHNPTQTSYARRHPPCGQLNETQSRK